MVPSITTSDAMTAASCQLAAPGLTLKVFHKNEKSRRSSVPSWATLTDDDG
jgi:hypothetical protein